MRKRAHHRFQVRLQFLPYVTRRVKHSITLPHTFVTLQPWTYNYKTANAHRTLPPFSLPIVLLSWRLFRKKTISELLYVLNSWSGLPVCRVPDTPDTREQAGERQASMPGSMASEAGRFLIERRALNQPYRKRCWPFYTELQLDCKQSRPFFG